MDHGVHLWKKNSSCDAMWYLQPILNELSQGARGRYFWKRFQRLWDIQDWFSWHCHADGGIKCSSWSNDHRSANYDSARRWNTGCLYSLRKFTPPYAATWKRHLPVLAMHQIQINCWDVSDGFSRPRAPAVNRRKFDDFFLGDIIYIYIYPLVMWASTNRNLMGLNRIF